MSRYVAFLRGVSPTNASMPALKACFEAAGFTAVRTLLSSGNVAFDARASVLPAIERRAEEAMRSGIGRSFGTIVRPAEHLQRFVESEPFARFRLAADAKRVVTFLRSPADATCELPIERDGAIILERAGAEVLSAYVPGPEGPVFMTLLERTFGTEITTRTFETVRKCARA